MPHLVLLTLSKRRGRSLLLGMDGSSYSPQEFCWFHSGWEVEWGYIVLHLSSTKPAEIWPHYYWVVINSWLSTRPPLLQSQQGGGRVLHCCQVDVEVQLPMPSPLTARWPGEAHYHLAGWKCQLPHRPLLTLSWGLGHIITACQWWKFRLFT